MMVPAHMAVLWQAQIVHRGVLVCCAHITSQIHTSSERRAYVTTQKQSRFACIVAAMEIMLQVHVIDAASDDALQQRHTVLHTLRQLGMSEEDLQSRVLEVWNKADCLDDSTPARLPEARRSFNPPSTPGTRRESPGNPEPLTDTEPAQEALWTALCSRIKAAAMQSGRQHSREVAEHLAKARRRGHRRTAHAAGKRSDLDIVPNPKTMEHRLHPTEWSSLTDALHSRERPAAGHRHDRWANSSELPEKAVGTAVGNGEMCVRIEELLATAVPEMQHEVFEVEAARGPGAGEQRGHTGGHHTTVPLVVSAATGLGLARLQIAIHDRLALTGMPDSDRDGG